MKILNDFKANLQTVEQPESRTENNISEDKDRGRGEPTPPKYQTGVGTARFLKHRKSTTSEESQSASSQPQDRALKGRGPVMDTNEGDAIEAFSQSGIERGMQSPDDNDSDDDKPLAFIAKGPAIQTATSVPVNSDSDDDKPLVPLLQGLAIQNAGSPGAPGTNISFRLPNTGPAPYAPFLPRPYSDYGMHREAMVMCTDYARDAAKLLTSEKGELDLRHANQMMKDLKSPPLSKDYVKHVQFTLSKLMEDTELASIINSTCKDAPPKGLAADAVSATLNLPAGQEPTGADARRAVVMALLGKIRQTDAASCFSTAPAICLHEADPRTVASDMKEMLEKNCLTFKDDENTSYQVPLNGSVNRESVQIKLNVDAEGNCHGEAGYDEMERPYSLSRTPGMRAAMNALGIPERDKNERIKSALQELAQMNNGSQVVSQQDIIERLASSTGNGTDSSRRSTAALNAFEAAETVGLLRSWENTLATGSTINKNKDHHKKIISMLRSDTPIDGKPELQSLQQISLKSQQQLASRFPSTNLQEMSNTILDGVDELVKQRFMRQYDPNLENNQDGDGRSNRGGWVLYLRKPSDDPSKWQPVDTPEKYQAAMAELVEVAAAKATLNFDGYHVQGMSNDPYENQQALRKIMTGLTDHINSEEFIKHSMIKMNENSRGRATGRASAPDETNTPWKQAGGGSAVFVARNYGSNVNSALQISSPKNQSLAPGEAADAANAMKFVCDGLDRMKPELNEKLGNSHPDFKVLVANARHEFTIKPTALSEIWSDGAQTKLTSDEWIDSALKQPAEQYLVEPRSAPPLSKVLQSLDTKLKLGSNNMKLVRDQIHQNSPKGDGQTYTIADVHAALDDYLSRMQNADKKLAAAETELTKIIPVPAKAIGDTNWANPDGENRLLGAVYDPFKKRVELLDMDADHGARHPWKKNMVDGFWGMWTPLGARTT